MRFQLFSFVGAAWGGGSEANCAIAYLDSRYVSYGICICLFAYVVCVLCAGTEAGLTRTLLAA